MKIHKLKAGEKATRITALVLTAALIFTSIDLAVFAAANEGIKTQEVITGLGSWMNRSPCSFCRSVHRKVKSYFLIPLL